MKIQIEGKNYTVLIDLGSSHCLDLQKETIGIIKNKKFLGTSEYVGIKGSTYQTNKFELSEIKISNLLVKNFSCFEESPFFLKDAKSWKSQNFWDYFKDRLDSFTIQGRIGFPLFSQFDCFWDFPNSNLYLATDLFSSHKYLLEGFTQIPFRIQKNGLTLEIATEEGLKTFLLDTGATRSILKNQEKNDRKNKKFKSLQLMIGNQDFGKWEFIIYDFSDKFECDCILGVDFFKKHAIGLDFHNQMAYIRDFRYSKVVGE